MDKKEIHKSGFVNIIGNPNVGKSTLMNALTGESLSVINSKPQTTRHRILGIISDDDYQIVLSDTPGTIQNPNYKMQDAMNKFAYSVFIDGDIILFMTDVTEEYTGDELIFQKLSKVKVPCFLIINKIDLLDEIELLQEKINWWKDKLVFTDVFTISAINKSGTDTMLNRIVELLPEGPAYYPKEQLSDKPQRFFVSEIIRGKILELYHQEIPYSCEVVIDRFEEMEKNNEPFTKIFADIYVMRKTQKQIIIGRKGESIKKLGIQSRKLIEEYLGNRIYLELYVRVKDKWRDDERLLKSFGYLNK